MYKHVDMIHMSMYINHSALQHLAAFKVKTLTTSNIAHNNK